MSTTVKCKACGERNPVAQLHCRSCGAKLDFSGINLRRPARWKVALKRGLRFVILTVLLAILITALWPATPKGAVGTEDEAYAAWQKVQSLQTAYRTGQRQRHVFSEAEVNAYLAVRLAEARPETADGSFRLPLEEINIAFTDSGFVALIGVRRAFLKLTYELVGRAEVIDDELVVDIQRLTLGRTPLPGPLQSMIEQRLATLVGAFTVERELMSQTAEIGFRESQMRLRVDP